MIPSCFIMVISLYSTEILISFVLGRPIKAQVGAMKILTNLYV